MQITRHATAPSLEHPDFWIHEFDAGLWRRVVVALFGNNDLSGDHPIAAYGWVEKKN